jgi:hypothetical protein
MKWLLIFLCVNINNPNDVPGKLTLEFDTKQQCESSLKTMTYWLKFDTFKVVGNCEEANESKRNN